MTPGIGKRVTFPAHGEAERPQQAGWEEAAGQDPTPALSPAFPSPPPQGEMEPGGVAEVPSSAARERNWRDRTDQKARPKRDVHGWLILDKPVGMTSTHAVSVVKRLFSAKRAGHAGTLDPLASGCLPIALGEATKTVMYVMDGAQALPFHGELGR